MCFLTFSRGHYYTFSYATFYPSLVAAERSEAALGLLFHRCAFLISTLDKRECNDTSE